MSTTNALKTQGTEFFMKKGTGTGATIVNIAEIRSMDGIGGGSTDTIDVTDWNSTAKEKLTGLTDNGELTMEANFGSQTSMQELYTKKASGEVTSFWLAFSESATDVTIAAGTVTVPTTRTVFPMTGTVKQIVLQGQQNDAWRARVTIELSGSITPSWKA
jgi:hypothetical protein